MKTGVGCAVVFLVLVKLALIAFLCFLAYMLVMHYAG